MDKSIIDPLTPDLAETIAGHYKNRGVCSDLATTLSMSLMDESTVDALVFPFLLELIDGFNKGGRVPFVLSFVAPNKRNPVDLLYSTTVMTAYRRALLPWYAADRLRMEANKVLRLRLVASLFCTGWSVGLATVSEATAITEGRRQINEVCGISRLWFTGMVGHVDLEKISSVTTISARERVAWGQLASSISFGPMRVLTQAEMAKEAINRGW